MEQKKTLWIILASGFFLGVIILTAMILFKPAASETPLRVSTNPIEFTSSEPEEKTSDSGVSLVDENAISNLSAVDETEEKTEASENKPQELKIDATVTIDLNQTGSSNVTAKSEAAQKAIDTKKSSEVPSTIYTAAPSGKSKAEVAAESKAASMNKNNKGTYQAKQSAPVEPVVQAKYWVQAASYTSKKTADLARATLDQNRIPAEVFTFKDSKNNLFYRVRVGPYTTKSEAEYWQNRICTIDSFKDSKSYITVN